MAHSVAASEQLLQLGGPNLLLALLPTPPPPKPETGEGLPWFCCPHASATHAGPGYLLCGLRLSTLQVLCVMPYLCMFAPQMTSLPPRHLRKVRRHPRSTRPAQRRNRLQAIALLPLSRWVPTNTPGESPARHIHNPMATKLRGSACQVSTACTLTITVSLPLLSTTGGCTGCPAPFGGGRPPAPARVPAPCNQG